MNEIYWITRLDCIHDLSVGVFVIATVLLFIASIVYLVNYHSQEERENGLNEWDKEEWQYALLAMKFLKPTAITMIVTALLITFVPTKKDALLIWGVGGTIDYVKSNPTIGKLPDKVVTALDKWIDSFNDEDKSDE